MKRRAGALRAGAVTLRPGGIMDWHSTRNREELLIGIRGRARVECDGARGGLVTRTLKAGARLFIPRQTRHRVVNRSRSAARYLYITA